LHADVNPGKTPIEVIVVQLQQDTVAVGQASEIVAYALPR
jgi:hypothetical protein